MPGQYIYGALSNIAETIERETERKRTEAQEAAALRKLITIYRPGLKDDAMTANLADLRGTSQAIHLQDLQQERESQQALRTAETGNFEQLASERAAAAERAKRQDEQAGPFAKFIHNAMTNAEKPSSFLDAYLQAREIFPYGAEGAEKNPGFARLVNEHLAKQQEDLTPSVWEDPATGFRVFSRGKTSIPSGVNPEKVRQTGGPQMSEDHHFYFDGKRWIGIHETHAPIGSKFTSIGGAIAVITPEGQIWDWKAENPMAPMMRNLAPGAQTTTTPGAPAPAPAALTPWERYQQGKPK